MNSHAICKTCGGEFSNPAFLIDHFNKSHRPKLCLRCNAEKFHPSPELFCDPCNKILRDREKIKDRVARLDSAILRAANKQIEWQSCLDSLLIRRQEILDQRTYTNGNYLQEFCGHGLIRGKCVPCNPIFAKMTEAGFKNAEKLHQERLRKEADSLRQKMLQKKYKEEIIEIEIDLD